MTTFHSPAVHGGLREPHCIARGLFRGVLAVLVALALQGASARAQVWYRFTELPISPYGINSSGQIVGDGPEDAYLYTNGVTQDLGSLGGQGSTGGSAATAINDAGQIVGTSYTSSLTWDGFLYSNGTMLDLGSFGGADTEALAINNAGTVVGYSDIANPSSGTGMSAFLYSNGTLTDLDALLGGTHNTSANGVNDAGTIVGTALTAGLTTGFVYSNGSVTKIPNSEANAINDAGQVVGGMSFSAGWRAFLWSATSGATDLGTLPAPYNFESEAMAINASGIVVGESYTTWGTDKYPTSLPTAFVYVDGKMEDLNNLTSLPAGCTLDAATAINASGQIVGWGNLGGFLLTPLEPGDANGDGRVDINDLTIVLANFGQTGCAWSQGCMDGNPTGAVDVDDLTIVLSNFGYGTTAGAGPATTPEPCALVLLLAALACLLARRPHLLGAAASQTSRSASGIYRARGA